MTSRASHEAEEANRRKSDELAGLAQRNRTLGDELARKVVRIAELEERLEALKAERSVEVTIPEENLRKAEELVRKGEALEREAERLREHLENQVANAPAVTVSLGFSAGNRWKTLVITGDRNLDLGAALHALEVHALELEAEVDFRASLEARGAGELLDQVVELDDDEDDPTGGPFA